MKRTGVVIVVALFMLAGPGCSDDSSSNTGGDGGVGADQGGAGTLSMDQLLKGCIRASACGIKTYPYLGNCIDAYLTLYRSQGLAPAYDSIYTCVNTAKGDCDAVAKCFRRGVACDKDSKATCDGTVANSCDLIDRRLYGIDCALAGLKCGLPSGAGQQSSAICTTGPCDSSFKTKCDGTKLLSCTYGVTEVTECALQNMSCGYYGWKNKSYACEGGTTDKCSTYGKWTFKSVCEGNVLVTCQHGKKHRQDCSKLVHQKTSCNAGSCVPAGKECSSNMNRCAGAKLESCLDGKWKQFDCAALGLGDCKPGGTVGANCSRKSI